MKRGRLSGGAKDRIEFIFYMRVEISAFIHGRNRKLVFKVIRPYCPPWFIRLSVLLHGIGGVALLSDVGLWPFWMTLLLGNHLLITLLVFWPKSDLLGPNIQRIRSDASEAIYLTFDDGPNPNVTPKVLDLLDQYDCRCTFFVIGAHVREHPELVREIVRRGHAIGNHSDSHAHTFAMQGIRGFVRELKTSQQCIFDATGFWPRYFRAPFGFRSPLLEPALCKTGLQLVSWTRRGFDTRCRSPGKILERLTFNLTSGEILLLHDGPFGRDIEGEPMALRVLPKLLETLKENGFCSAALPHPHEH